MKIQYCSDLHLEFEQNSRYLKQHPLKVCGDILILAGDIVPLHDENFKHPFFSFIADHFEQVYWVPGNHEFYHTDISHYSSSFNIELRSNIHLLHNKSVIINKCNLIFSTLWSHISSANEKIIEKGVSDFSCILKNDKRLRVSDFNQLHLESITFIKQALIDNPKSIVFSHHLPSPRCNSSIHAHSEINEAFCVDLTSLIISSDIRFWIYGHSHFNQQPIYLPNTILLTNQLGYVQNNEHLSFRNGAYISV